MGRNTVGREARKKEAIPSETMQNGIQLHLSGLSIRKAAKEAKVPYPTLRRYIIKYANDQSCTLEPQYNASKIFTEEQEESLKDYVLDCAIRFYGLTSKDCCRIAYQMAVINNINMPPSWQRYEMAGRDWMRGFRARHPQLSIKKPEACSMARATSFNKVNVQKFFDNLKQVLNRNICFGNGSRIYNLDETSTTTVQRPQKVLAARGSNVSKITSGERGVLVTTCCIVNAIGQALPPAMIFPRKNFKPHMLHGAPPGTLELAAASGWTNAQLFVEVMKHFIQFTSASKDNPALLILDNHESHLSIEALDLAKGSDVTILTLHPHTTARMQPLDVGLNGPFKTYYNAAVDSWLLHNPGKTFTIYNVAECVGIAYMRALTPTNITQAFKKCGIFPFDNNIYTDIDFAPSEITNRPATESVTELVADCQEPDAHERCDSPSILTPYFGFNDDETDAESDHIIDDCLYKEPVPSTSYVQPSQTALEEETSRTTIANISKILHEPTTSSPRLQPKTKLQTHSSEVSHSRTPGNFISPKMFRPPLKAGPRKNRLKRKAGKSMIATDTPEKDALMESKIPKKAKVAKTILFANSVKRRGKSVSSSDEEEEEFIASGSSAGGENFIVDSEEEEVVLKDNFPLLTRKPCSDDYVIVAFNTKKTKVYYIAQILEELDDVCDYYVSYFKLKHKDTQTFYMPLEPETAGLNKNDIMYILPPPIIEGTVRRQTTYKFPVDMSLLNLRY